LPRVEAPEGWVKKVERAREGKVWVGYFHVWETTKDGRSVRRKKEKTLGAATKPKHEVVKQLAEYIAEHTGKLAKQGESISTFAELWTAFSAVKSGQWSKKTRENLACLFGKHVLPEIGRQGMRDVTLTPLQLLLNKLAEERFSKSVVGQIRTYVKACFEYEFARRTLGNEIFIVSMSYCGFLGCADCGLPRFWSCVLKISRGNARSKRGSLGIRTGMIPALSCFRARPEPRSALGTI
jgi:histone H3/H4